MGYHIYIKKGTKYRSGYVSRGSPIRTYGNRIVTFASKAQAKKRLIAKIHQQQPISRKMSNKQILSVFRFKKVRG